MPRFSPPPPLMEEKLINCFAVVLEYIVYELGGSFSIRSKVDIQAERFKLLAIRSLPSKKAKRQFFDFNVLLPGCFSPTLFFRSNRRDQIQQLGRTISLDDPEPHQLIIGTLPAASKGQSPKLNKNSVLGNFT
uniref:Uncharacterized protein n=1 Tax=Romanomermis culicivorax TaxID=13658 RepID=A0A915J0S6_ROMCU